MSQPPSKTHIIDKSNYTIHHLVHLPSSPLPPLPPFSLRIRPRLLGLTTNNLSYARLGGLLGWFSTYPLPPHTPAPYNDPKTYARIAAWGYAEIVESTVPSIPAGKSIYGFLPITDGLESMQIEIATRDGAELPGQIVVVDEHRRGLMKVYNQYEVCAPLEELEKQVGRESLGYDALMSALFLSAFNFNRYCFAWEEGKRVNPAGEGVWNEGDADLKDAVVVLLNASGKTALSFAYCLRNNRPTGEQPRKIVGVGSEKSAATIRQSGLYDEVVLNSEADAIKTEIETSPPKRVVLVDFGARPGIAPEWFNTLSASSVPVSRIVVGGEVSVLDPEEMKKRLADRGKIVAMNASALREWAIKVDGRAHFEDVKTAFEGFKGQNKALSLVLREGFEHWEQGWQAICKDQVKADVGLVCRL